MKTSNANQPGEGSHAVVRGHTGTLRAGSSGIDFTNADATTVDGVTSITLSGLSGNDLTDGALQLVAELGVASLTAITPAQLVANTDNWAPTDATTTEPLSTATIVRASTDASRSLTGIVAPTLERLVILENVGAFDLVLKHNVTSTAANRFYCPNDTDVTLQKDSTAILVYDTTSSRWRVIGGGGGGAAGPAGATSIGPPGQDGEDGFSIPGQKGDVGPQGAETYSNHGNTGATENVDFSVATVHRLVLDANCTISFVNPPAASIPGWVTLRLVQDSNGSRTVTWPASVYWVGGVAPTLLTTADAVDLVTFMTDDGGVVYYGTFRGVGLTGATGQTGARGYDGVDGDDGLIMPGPQGLQGIPGVSNIPGPVGPQGQQGDDGDDGTPMPGNPGPAGPDMTAVSDYTEANTSFTLAASGDIITRTVTLTAGTYAVHAHVRTTTMGSPTQPGTAILRWGGTTFGTQIDLRPTADAKFTLFGVFAHAGGSVTVDCRFSWEAGTTRFGANGTTEARFGQKLLIYRIGS